MKSQEPAFNVPENPHGNTTHIMTTFKKNTIERYQAPITPESQIPKTKQFLNRRILETEIPKIKIHDIPEFQNLKVRKSSSRKFGNPRLLKIKQCPKAE